MWISCSFPLFSSLWSYIFFPTLFSSFLSSPCFLPPNRWSWGYGCSPPPSQGLQHRLRGLRERRDHRRRGFASSRGRLKQPQNITLFSQIAWHHLLPPNTMSTAVIIFYFCILFIAFYIGKKNGIVLILVCFHYIYVVYLDLRVHSSTDFFFFFPNSQLHGVTRQEKYVLYLRCCF